MVIMHTAGNTRYMRTGKAIKHYRVSISFVFFIFGLVFLDPKISPSQTSHGGITISAVGDIMMGSLFPVEDLPPESGDFLFNSVKPYFSDSDIVFGNLEGSFLDEGECIKKCSNPETCYAFRMPEVYVRHLVNTGFNLLSVANNHIGDFGKTGIEKTADVLKQAGIHYAGVHNQASIFFDSAALRIGFCAFSPNQACPDPRDIESSKRAVEFLNGFCDIVIVSVHAGAEGEKNRHVTRKTEIFHEENRGNVHAFAHGVIDAGADLVLGHGPHVTRAIELYKGRLIAYSLGNFCTYGRFNLNGRNGIAPILRMNLSRNGEFLNGDIIPVFQKPRKGPDVDRKKRAVSEIIELTAHDFPESGLIISPDGKINVKNHSSR